MSDRSTSDRSGPQYLNANGSTTSKRPGITRKMGKEDRALRNRTSHRPKKIDPDTAKQLAEALKMFLS